MQVKIDSFSDETFAEVVRISRSFTEVSYRLGYKMKSGVLFTRIRKRIRDMGLSTNHFLLSSKRPRKRCAENIFVQESTADQKTLRKYYIRGNYSEYKCSICGQEPIWNHKPMTLILDHVNGINNDDRIENLRWVCPNCNQQLDTTGSKNIVKQRDKAH